MMRLLRFLLVLLTLVACTTQPPSPPSMLGGEGEARRATVTLANGTSQAAVVYIAFGADSVVVPTSLPGCAVTGPLTCTMQLAAHEQRALPLLGKYLNATLSFNAPVTCNTTKAELNLNNPRWYDTLDVSLVDGFSNKVKVEAGSAVLEVKSASGNEKALGVFPLGCDICVARQSPPCGMSPGKSGCKSGSQYKPDVPCQWQGAVKGGSTTTRVTLVE